MTSSFNKTDLSLGCFFFFFFAAGYAYLKCKMSNFSMDDNLPVGRESASVLLAVEKLERSPALYEVGEAQNHWQVGLTL